MKHLFALFFIFFSTSFLFSGWKLVDRLVYPGGDIKYAYPYESLSCADERNCIAVGNMMNEMPWFRSTSDGGETWTTCYADSSYRSNMAIPSCRVWKAAYLDSNLCIAFGDSNTIWRSTDKCQTWLRVSLGGKYNSNQNPIFSISGKDRKNIWLISPWDLFKSEDSGFTFKRIDINLPDTIKPVVLREVQTPEINNIFILGWRDSLGYYIIHSSDNGVGWNCYVSLPKRIQTIYYFNKDIAWGAGRQQIEYGSTKYRSIILGTSDGGKNWEVQLDTLDTYKTGFFRLKFKDSLNGIAIGERWNVWRTSNGGKMWYKDSTINYSTLELSLNDIEFLGNSDLLGVSWNDRIYKYYSGTSVEEIYNPDQFFIFPNPATDFIEINVRAEQAMPLQIRIYDVFGQEINLTQSQDYPTPTLPEGRELRLDVSGLPSGLYFVRVGDKVGKFLKY